MAKRAKPEQSPRRGDDATTAGGPSGPSARTPASLPRPAGKGPREDSAGEGSGKGPAHEGAEAGGEAPGRARADLSRRRLLGTVGAAGAAGLVVGAAGGGVAVAENRDDAPRLSSLGSTRLPFRPDHGAPQAGIATRAQSCGHLVAFDLAPGAGRREAAALLRRWTATAREVAEGRPTAEDTGVALDAGPSSLTVTFGFGHSFFGRTGLTARRPTELDPLPHFSSDALDPHRSDGDLWIQIGADDALVAFHALRALQKDAAGAARLRWQMNGFNRAPGATPRPRTVRNLMGQVDGTGNPSPSDHDFAEKIYAGSATSQDWMRGGSFAVVRRIRMLLDDWEKQTLDKQQRVIGRRKSDGAPLTGGTEHTPLDLDRTGSDGSPVIPADAHARIAGPDANQGATLLRRTFSYHDGYRSDGAPDAGLLFVCWQADPLRGFTPIQIKLDRGDALSSFIRHEASGLYAVPRAPGRDGYVGEELLA